MQFLSRRSVLAIAAVVDVALHARPVPVAAKALAARHNLPPRHLETLLQALVRAHILKGVRGPRGGYELARERRRISAGDIVRAAISEPADGGAPGIAYSPLVGDVVGPTIERATEAFLATLDAVTIEDLCRRAQRATVADGSGRVAGADFTI
jgi:Rrf2 family iron-sulfur cluster assembly transcriptional regulator